MYPFRQAGISLISLMIGLLISMIAVLGMMSLYNTLVKSTVQSTRDARIAGERSAAILVASRQLLGAGYGIDATRNDELLLLTETTLTLDGDRGSLTGGSVVVGDGEGNALIWRARPDGLNTWCSGLYAPPSSEQVGLYLLQPQRCGTVTEPETWEVRPLFIDNNDAADERSRLPITISIKSGDCRVYGIAGEGSLDVSLDTRDRTGNEVTSTTCLINF